MASRLQGCNKGVFGLHSWDLNECGKKPPQKSSSSPPKPANAAGVKPGQEIMAKYNYKKNPDSPIGHELDMTQKEKLTFLDVFSEHWWHARNSSGEEGYVPSSYCMVMEEKVSSLPWLQGKKTEELPPVNPVFKKYEPTYDLKGEVRGINRYECKPCEKFFNGIQPYKAHMASKSHRETIEYMNEDS